MNTNTQPNQEPERNKEVQPKPTRPEVNPAKPAEKTEVDLDKGKTKTYDKGTPKQVQ